MSAAFRLTPADAARYVRLRRRMLIDTPVAFAASPEDDVASDEAFVARALGPENAIFAVAAGDELVAACGVMRQTKAKFRHRADIWGVYVEPAHRGKGHARAVIAAAIELARTWDGVEWLDIGVSAATPGAWKLYERLGFVAWGREPAATAIGDERHDEIFLALRL